MYMSRLAVTFGYVSCLVAGFQVNGPFGQSLIQTKVLIEAMFAEASHFADYSSRNNV